jgi:hypothetical protein
VRAIAESDGRGRIGHALGVRGDATVSNVLVWELRQGREISAQLGQRLLEIWILDPLRLVGDFLEIQSESCWWEICQRPPGRKNWRG